MSEVVLVHGAWHGAWCWAEVVDEHDALGVSNEAVELPPIRRSSPARGSSRS
jgi:hypothetical protein